ncbi:MAG: alpha/beta hydrolase [Nitrospirae bacterium]|nr:alpha/beta hydrolase [Nitrospirota bacterium]
MKILSELQYCFSQKRRKKPVSGYVRLILCLSNSRGEALPRVVSLLFIFLISLFVTIGCFTNKIPIDTIYYKNHGEGKNNLFVFLHGRGGSARDFEDNGFVQETRKEDLPVDIVSVEAQLGYYLNQSIVKRLKKDVIGPARAAGYEHVWIVGVSMGGLGALLYARAYPEDIDGLLLIAPYLGDPPVIKEISDSGGVMKWHPLEIDETDWQRELWKWLQSYTSKPKNTSGLYLAYGLDDKFYTSDNLLAEVLPGSHVFTVKGGHDWPTWRYLWSEFISAAGKEF